MKELINDHASPRNRDGQQQSSRQELHLADQKTILNQSKQKAMMHSIVSAKIRRLKKYDDI